MNFQLQHTFLYLSVTLYFYNMRINYTHVCITFFCQVPFTRILTGCFKYLNTKWRQLRDFTNLR